MPNGNTVYFICSIPLLKYSPLKVVQFLPHRPYQNCLSYGRKSAETATSYWSPPPPLKAGSPLIWVFAHFWLFCTIVWKKWRGIFCENFIKKFKGKVAQMCHRSCSLAQGFYTKLYTKTAVSKSSIALGLGTLKLTFLSFGLSFWNLAHLFIMFMATKQGCLKFFNFCLARDLVMVFQSRKTG